MMQTAPAPEATPTDAPRTDRTRAKPDERLAMMGLNAIYQSLEKHTAPLEKRLAKDPYALRGLKAAKTAVKRAIDVAVDSVDDKSAAYIFHNSHGFEITVRPRSVVPEPGWMNCLRTDLEVVVEHTLRGDCATCMLTPGECNRCELRKVLLNLTSEPENKYGCGYKGATLNRRGSKP